MMNLGELLKSKEYADARKRVDGWRARLKGADAAEAGRVRSEKAEFFQSMAKQRPDLYAAFQIDDKTLSEEIFRKLTGRDIIID